MSTWQMRFMLFSVNSNWNHGAFIFQAKNKYMQMYNYWLNSSPLQPSEFLGKVPTMVSSVDGFALFARQQDFVPV